MFGPQPDSKRPLIRPSAFHRNLWSGDGCPGKSLEKTGPADREEHLAITNGGTVAHRGEGTCPKPPSMESQGSIHPEWLECSKF